MAAALNLINLSSIELSLSDFGRTESPAKQVAAPTLARPEVAMEFSRFFTQVMGQGGKQGKRKNAAEVSQDKQSKRVRRMSPTKDKMRPTKEKEIMSPSDSSHVLHGFGLVRPLAFSHSGRC